MKSGVVFLGGMGAGAGLLFLFDPSSGRRRRARLGDKLVHDARSVVAGARKTSRDVIHRTRGIAARAGAGFSRRAVTDDEIVEERIRATLGRVCSHPGAIDVICDQGRAQLSGAVLEGERHDVIAAMYGVRGVKTISDLLEVHATSDGVPDLQGGARRRGSRINILQGRWSRSTALLAGLTGAALIAVGARSGRRLGKAAVGAGGLLLMRALYNEPVDAILGLGARGGIQVHKVIHVDGPVEEVFSFWSNLESFPRFMTHVKEVRRTGDRRYHWKVGPFHWEAEVTRLEPNQLIAWRSLEGAAVRSRGSVRFRHDGHRGTEISIQFSYRPPAGRLGHGVAKLLRADPKRQLDDDLLRFKSLIEQGSATGRRGTVLREEVSGG